jgi:hypothetical protein
MGRQKRGALSGFQAGGHAWWETAISDIALVWTGRGKPRPYQCSTRSNLRMLGSVQTSCSSMLLVENSLTTAPSWPCQRWGRVLRSHACHSRYQCSGAAANSDGPVRVGT